MGNKLPKTESPQARAAFEAYLRQDWQHRSLRRLAKELGKCVSLLKRWSAAHNWAERAAEHDRNNPVIKAFWEEHRRRVIAEYEARRAAVRARMRELYWERRRAKEGLR